MYKKTTKPNVSLQVDFVKGNGIRLYDDQGVEYLDSVSGTFNVPLGYSHPDVVTRLNQQLENLAHVSSSFSRNAKTEVARRLQDVAPEGLREVWLRDITGSTANEGAVKIAQKATGKRDIVTFNYAHHGQTAYTTGLSGNAFRRSNFYVSTGVTKIQTHPPYCYRCPFKAKYPGCGFLCVENIESQLKHQGSGTVAAVMVEPVLGNGGNIVPPTGYFQALRKLCDEHQLLLIADEVQTGIGRTGYMFASDAFSIQPDIVTLAKGLGGIGVPVAAILYKPALKVLEKWEHSFTSGGNLFALAAAESTLDVIGAEGFLEQVRKKGVLLGTLLSKLKAKYSCIGDVRGLGYMWGLEMIKEDGSPAVDLTNQILKVAFENQRLIVRTSQYGFGNVVKVRPALIATEEDLEEIVFRLDQTMASMNLK